MSTSSNSKFNKRESTIQKLNCNKIFKLLLHAGLLTLCVFLSCIYLQDWHSPKQIINYKAIYSFQWSIDSIINWLKTWLIFIAVKFCTPVIILAYMFWIVRTKAYYKLLKDEFISQYDYKYNQIHKLSIPVQQVKQKTQIYAYEQKAQQTSRFVDYTQPNISNQQHDGESLQSSSLNTSRQMVKSMSRSMLGSLKSISNAKSLNMSLNHQIDKSYLKTHKMIETITKKNIPAARGKDLTTLFEKDNIASQSGFLNSSDVSSDEVKVRIKNKKYYDMISESQNDAYQKWYEQTSKKFIETVRNEKFEKQIIQRTLQMRKGLEKEIVTFIKEYKQNKQDIKHCLIKYYNLKIQGYDNAAKNFKGPYDLNEIFKKDTKLGSNNLMSISSHVKDKQVSEQKLNKIVTSAYDLLRKLKEMNITLRKPAEKNMAEQQIQRLLSKRQYYHVLLNISTISGQSDSLVQIKLRHLEKGLRLLQSRKNGLSSLNSFTSTNNLMLNQMDILQSIQLENIREMVSVRVTLLSFFVNKINLLTSNKQFKIKMKQAISYDSGYLSQVIESFKPSNFAQIVCCKGYDNIIPHYDLKITKTSQTNQESRLLNCQPGINNPFSVILLLCKKIQETFMNQKNYQILLKTTNQIRKTEQLRNFIDSLYPVIKF